MRPEEFLSRHEPSDAQAREPKVLDFSMSLIPCFAVRELQSSF
jgi:hypothetical protein